MSESDPSPAAAVADVVDRFKAACRQNPDGTHIRDFLPSSDHALWPDITRALLRADLELRSQQGRTVSLEPYLQQIPQLASASFLPQLLYEEFRVRLLSGNEPDLGAYQARFPQHFSQLLNLVQKELVGSAEVLATRNTGARALPAAMPVVPSPGKVLSVGGGYKLLKTIGRGSYGEVYLAEAPGGVHVAIKVILRPLDEKESKRESQALELMKNLRHQSLLSVHGFWVLEDQLLIVTELADGSLRDRLKECRAQGQPGIPLGELLTYFREAAEALDFLHGHHILHRDIKPDNILLFGRHSKVADFGLAKLFEERVAQSLSISGTPVYMPPEIWHGSVSVHSDQYSLALSYAEMRLCRRVFAGESITDLVTAHLQMEPTLDPLPEAEQAVLHRALAKKPEERYESCLAWIDALESALLGGPSRSARLRELGSVRPSDGSDAVEAAPAPEGDGSPRSRPTFRETPQTLSPGNDTTPTGDFVPREVPDERGKPIAPVEVQHAEWNEPRRPPRSASRVPIVFGLLLLLGSGGFAAYYFGPWRGNSGVGPSVAGTAAGELTDVPALLQRAQVRIEQNDYDLALADLNRVIELKPKAALAFALRGGVRWRQKDYTAAIEDCAKALALDDQSALAYLYRGEARRARGQVAEARQDFEAASRLDPKLDVPAFPGLVRAFPVPTGRPQRVNSVALARDNRHIVSGADDYAVRLWDVATGEHKELYKHDKEVRSVALSPDGRYVLSGGRDYAVRLWSVADEREVRSFPGFEQPVWTVAFSPDGERVLAGGGVVDDVNGKDVPRDCVLRLWETATGKQLGRFEGHTGSVRSVAFAPDGKRAASGSDDGTVRLWGLSKEKAEQVFNVHTDAVVAVAFAPDGERIASASRDGTVRLWQVGRPDPVLQLKRADKTGVWGVAFARDGKHVVTADADKGLRWWDADTGDEVPGLGETSDAIYCLAIGADGRRAVTGDAKGTVRLWGLPK
jgi:serine/threonine protein kinase